MAKSSIEVDTEALLQRLIDEHAELKKACRVACDFAANRRGDDAAQVHAYLARTLATTMNPSPPDKLAEARTIESILDD